MRLRNIPRADAVLGACPLVIKEPDRYRGSWNADIFQNGHPIHIEIGMGKGQFLLTLAAQNPQINYVGIERYSSVLLRAVEKLPAHSGEGKLPLHSGEGKLPPLSGERNLLPYSGEGNSPMSQSTMPENIRFLCIDAADLPEIFSAGEVSRIYLNFSDPWPKARHARRRLTSKEYFARYDRILAADGQVEFKTDNRGLFDFSVEQLKASDIWEITACTYDLHRDASMNDGNVMTEYEEKFSSLGNPICKLVASRTI